MPDDKPLSDDEVERNIFLAFQAKVLARIVQSRPSGVMRNVFFISDYREAWKHVSGQENNAPKSTIRAQLKMSPYIRDSDHGDLPFFLLRPDKIPLLESMKLEDGGEESEQ